MRADSSECCHSDDPNNNCINNVFNNNNNNNNNINKCHLNSEENDSNFTKELQNNNENSNELVDLSFSLRIWCYLSFAILNVFGHLCDFLRVIGLAKNMFANEFNREGYVPLYGSFQSFFTRNYYKRIRDVFNQPINCVPGPIIQVMDRTSNDRNWTFECPGTTVTAINTGSYNYLGFAENSGSIVDKVENTMHKYGVGVSTTLHEFGITAIHKQLETLLAEFIGVESSIVFGMGFATNSLNIPCLATKGTLIISDELVHASLILGCRTSEAYIKVFKHNDMKDLEENIRNNIVDGHPITRRPWKKIIIIVEGIYSMEGTIVNLPEVIRLKKKYKCYLYLDEAHSIGAIGQRGRGVCDYFGCDPSDIDLLMGTFTKSFGAAGGYIAGRKQIIDFIRIESLGATYGTSMSPTITQQIISAISVIMGIDGTDEGQKRITRLIRNTQYFRKCMKEMGFIVLGNDDSPVVPVILGFGSKIAAVVRMSLSKGVATVGVGFPATSLTTGRARFCMSAAHTKQMLEKVLDVINEIGDQIAIKYEKKGKSNTDIIY